MPDVARQDEPSKDDPSQHAPAIVGDRFRLVRLLERRRGRESWVVEEACRPDGGSAVGPGWAEFPIHLQVVDEGVAPSVRMRLLHDAEALRTLRCDSLVRVIAAGRDRGRVYLATEWTEGERLDRRLARGRLTIDETLHVARDLLAALAAAHGRGVVHGDLGSENVILTAGEGDGAPARAVLLGFGLPRDVFLDSYEVSAGIARYMSPERAGLLAVESDARADLYSLGALLYECLSGDPPFPGESLTEVLRQHLCAPVPTLRAGSSEVPRALEQVVRRLLQKEPRDRYQSAEGALADVERLLRERESGTVDPVFPLGGADARGELVEPSFVGRERELAELLSHLSRARGGNGSLVYVEAESGGGKTRLLEELSRRCTSRTLVIGGRAVERGGPPLRVLSRVVDGLVDALERDDALRARVQGALRDDHAEALADAFPSLGAVLGVTTAARSSASPEEAAAARSVAAFTGLLEAMGSPDRPAVLLLDDCQWADEAAFAILRAFHARRRERPGGAWILVVAAFRSEEVGDDHPLRGIPGVARVALPPLEGAQVQRLAESMAGTLPADALEIVRDLSAGNAFMACAAMQGMVETGALAPEDGRFHLVRERLAETSASREGADFLARRMDRLPAATLRFLSAGAVLGREFDVEAAAALAEVSAEELLVALADARRRRIVWSRTRGSRLLFTHDKLREALRARLPEARRQELHRRSAERLEQEGSADPFEIAWHFDAAGLAARALPWALEAGAIARARHALDTAEQQYRIARRGVADGGADPSVRCRIAEGLGDVLMLRGRYPEAEQELRDARALARGRVDAARLEGKLGELAFKRGEHRTAGAHIEEGLRLLDRSVPQGTLQTSVRLAREILVQAGHSLLPRLFLARRPLAGADEELLAVRLLSRLAYVSWFERGNAATLWAHLRELNLAERLPPTAELAQAWSEHAPAMTMLPWFSRGLEYARRSHDLRREMGDLWGQAQSLAFRGVVLYAASRFEECVVSIREAMRLFERTGDRWELNTAHSHLAYSLHRLGRLDEARREAEALYRSGLEIGDAQARGLALGIRARVSEGAIPAEEIEAELAHPTADVETRAEVLMARAVWLLARDRAEEAAVALEEAQRLVDRAGLRQEYVAPVLPWRATALRRQLETMSPYDPAARRAVMADARRTAARAVRIARAYRNNLPHALRERALLRAMSGRLRAARRDFDHSIACAASLGMTVEEAQSRGARGRVGQAAGWPDAVEDLRAASRLPRVTPPREAVPPPREPNPSAAVDGETAGSPEPGIVSLAERFGLLLVTGRRLASAISRDDVFDAVRDSAMTLLRADDCRLFDVSGDVPSPISPADEGPFAEELLGRALETSMPAASSRAERSTRSLPAGVRSRGARSGSIEAREREEAHAVLCAPIRARGRTVACFQVTHRIAGLFGDVELRLAEFVAELAGAALENAEGFSQAQALSEELERRVEERRRAEEALRESDRRKEEFLAVLSHELRNPLGPVLLSLSILEQAPPGSEKARRALDVIDRQAHHMTRLIEDLLDVSRISRGKISLRRERIDLARLLRRVAEDHESLFESREVALGISVPDDPVWIDADPVRIGQVAGNLLHNAAKFTEAGGTTSLALRTEPGAAILSVRDSGAGVAPEMLGRLFEAFAQADETLDRSRGGLGLGLALVKGLTELHGGRVIARSDGPGTGTEIEVRLPRGDGPLRGAGDGGRAIGREPLRRCVLVIDDNLDAAETLRNALELQGHQVFVAHAGARGLSLAREIGPDVVFCDIGLPQMDGYAVARAFRADPELREIHLVALTGYALPEDHARARAAGFDRHLAKPATLARLQAILAEIPPRSS